MSQNEKYVVFASPEKLHAYDVATLREDGVYRAQISNKTLEQMQEERPDARQYSMDEFVEITEKAATTDPQEVTEEYYWNRLEVLPPGGWCRSSPGSESFYMIEFLTGRVTEHLVAIGSGESRRYFSFNAPVMNSHSARLDKVTAWLNPEPQQA